MVSYFTQKIEAIETELPQAPALASVPFPVFLSGCYEHIPTPAAPLQIISWTDLCLFAVSSCSPLIFFKTLWLYPFNLLKLLL